MSKPKVIKAVEKHFKVPKDYFKGLKFKIGFPKGVKIWCDCSHCNGAPVDLPSINKSGNKKK